MNLGVVSSFAYLVHTYLTMNLTLHASCELVTLGELAVAGASGGSGSLTVRGQTYLSPR